MINSVITSFPSQSTILFDYEHKQGEGEIGHMLLNAALIDMIRRLNEGYCATLIEPRSITLCRGQTTLTYTGRKPDILVMAIMIGFCRRLGFEKQQVLLSHAASERIAALTKERGELIISLNADFNVSLGLPNLLGAAEKVIALAVTTKIKPDQIKRVVASGLGEDVYRKDLRSFLNDPETRTRVVATTLKPA